MEKNVIILLVLLQTISCSSKKDVCKLREVKTLFTTVGVYQGQIAGYTHYVLIKDFSKKCIDSSSMVNYALAYMDTIKNDKPADIIKFFASDEKFIPNETSQEMKEINKSCLVDIGFDTETRKPNDFIFYDEKGDIIYWGNRWIPFPKGADIYSIERIKK